MRLFIAINFDEETKQNILNVQRRLRELGHGNFSKPENLHLTLAFLGEVAPARVQAVRKAMYNITLQPMHLTFDHVGVSNATAATSGGSALRRIRRCGNYKKN